MKLQVKQLDERTRLTIANALLDYYPNIAEELIDFPGGTQGLSACISHGELILCELQYDEPQDDVQVLGRG